MLNGNLLLFYSTCIHNLEPVSVYEVRTRDRKNWSQLYRQPRNGCTDSPVMVPNGPARPAAWAHSSIIGHLRPNRIGRAARTRVRRSTTQKVYNIH
jgi:hypothetical protein